MKCEIKFKNRIKDLHVESILNTRSIIRYIICTKVRTGAEFTNSALYVVPIASREISPFARVHRIHLDARRYGNNELCT